MKNKITIILSILFVWTIYGCDDFIDLQPENAVSYTNAFNTPTDMESILSTGQAALNGVLTGISPQELVGAYINGLNKNIYSQPQNIDLLSHNWVPGMIDLGNWGGYYSLIGYGNILVSNIKDSWKQESKDYYLGQGNFLKSIAYFELARRWGEAPIVPDNDYEGPRRGKSSTKELLDVAEKFGIEAFNHLPKYENLYFSDGFKITNKQYANKEIAAALLAQIYAWRGAVEENTNDLKVKYWKEADKYASMIIDGDLKGYATLAPTIQDMVDNTLNSRGGSESIFELDYDTKYTKKMHQVPFVNGIKMFSFPYKHGVNGSDMPELSISCKLVNDMYGEAGTTDKRKEVYFPETDTRYDPTAVIDWPDRPISITWFEPFPGWRFPRYEGGFPDEAPNRAYVKKFYKQFIYTDDPNQPERYYNIDANKVVWRMADIILIRAEVRNFYGNTAGAIADLNTIRKRAEASLYPSPKDNEGLQKAIFKEREKELIYENHRYFDIMRNKDYYKTELPANFRALTEQDVKDGALYLPVSNSASEYNNLITPNKYWFRKSN